MTRTAANTARHAVQLADPTTFNIECLLELTEVALNNIKKLLVEIV